MAERAAIERSDEPVTSERLVSDLRDIGIEAGDTILVHTSMNALGWVCGGASAVVDALLNVVTDEGTVVMPTHSTDYTDPEDWENPAVPNDWKATVRETRPPYRPGVTPTREMGADAECFRNYPGVRRSRHPSHSFAAWGTEREFVVEEHCFDQPMGETSPLASVYDLDGDVVVLGSTGAGGGDDATEGSGLGHDRNTSLHLAD